MNQTTDMPMVSDQNFSSSIATRSLSLSNRVLVVDDARSIRAVIVRLLATFGILSESAVDGFDAWQLLQRQRFDMVITDVEMPRWSGLELVRAMRQDRCRHIRHTPIVVTSTVTTEAIIDAIHSYPATYFMAKPVVASELYVLLRMIDTARHLRN